MGLTFIRKSVSPKAKELRAGTLAISGYPGPLCILPYQQNGNTLAILQPNDRVASVSTRFRDFGAGFGASCSSLVGDDPFSARMRLDSFLRHRYPIPNSIGLAL